MHRGLPEEVATDVSIMTRTGVARIIRFAFKLAQSRPRKLLTVVTKSNAQRHAMVMWDEIAAEVAKEFPDVTWDKMLVDAMTMRMTMKPSGGCVTVGCGRTWATSRPSTMPSPTSTRPSDARGRRSSAFAHRDLSRPQDRRMRPGESIRSSARQDRPQVPILSGWRRAKSKYAAAHTRPVFPEADVHKPGGQRDSRVPL